MLYPDCEPVPAALGRSGYRWLGVISREGDFVPTPDKLPVKRNVGFDADQVYNKGSLTDGYEHRSGLLIPGFMDFEVSESNAKEPFNYFHYGVFVPTVGGVVLDAKRDLDLATLDREIFNVRGTNGLHAVAARIRLVRKQLPPGGRPASPPAGVPAGYELVPYAALKDSPRVKAIRIVGEVLWAGQLSDRGEFLPDPELTPFARPREINRTFTASTVSQEASVLRMYYTLPIGGTTEGQPITVKSEEVYEYRSGRIIKGTLYDTGTFVPEVGSTVLDFKDYPVGQSGCRRVYNLPGVLRKLAQPAPAPPPK